MPHMSLGGSEDFYSTDEVKVYKDEGNKDEEKRSSENLTEEKLGLVTESEEGKNSSLQGNFAGSEKSTSTVSDDEKSSSGPTAPEQGFPGHLGFFLPPYGSPYSNGSSMANKFGLVHPPYTGMLVYNEYVQPPPAHKGYSGVYHDPKTGLPRPPVYAAYPAPPGQFPHPLYSPDFTGASWHRPGYSLTSGAFAGSFPPSLSSLSRYGPPGLLSHPGLGHPGIPHPASLGPGPKSELMSPQLLQDNHSNASGHSTESQQKKKNHIKKPLNAFMLFMKEQRPKVIAECTLRESSAINQILGRRWHALDRSEQAKYYEMARKEKELHLQLYPGWSARDNYAAHQKKKKRKKDGHSGGCGNSMSGMGSCGSGMSPMSGCSGMGGGSPLGGMCVDTENKPGECPNERKCRARYGMDQQSRWCNPCRRKKKCIRYKGSDGDDGRDPGGESLLRDESMDSSFLSGCDDSDPTNSVCSPGPVKCGHDSQRDSSLVSVRDLSLHHNSNFFNETNVIISKNNTVDWKYNSSFFNEMNKIGSGKNMINSEHTSRFLPETNIIGSQHNSHVVYDVTEIEPNQKSNIAGETTVMNSQCSLIKVENGSSESSDIMLFQPLSSNLFSLGTSSASSVPSSSPLSQLRRLTPHSVNSLLFSRPSLCVPYYNPPSPLAVPMPYPGFTPLYYQQNSATHAVPNGSSSSLEAKSSMAENN